MISKYDLRMFNYNHLYYFYTTARLSGVTKAAKSLRIAQPSLSIQLKTLEHELGIQLFEKVGRRLQLTTSGQRVYEFCRKMFEAGEELDDYLKHTSGQEIKRCRIGVAPEIERPFVADVLSSLIRAKELKEKPLLTMMTSEHKELINLLTSGEIDVVVTNHSVHSANIKTLAQLSMPVYAITNKKLLKSVSGTKLPVSKFLKLEKPDLVLPSENLKLRLESDLFIQKQKIRNPIVLESDILSVIVRAVIEGVGIGFIPKHYITKELNNKNLIILNNGESLWETTLFVLSRAKKIDDPIVQQIKNHFSKLAD